MRILGIMVRVTARAWKILPAMVITASLAPAVAQISGDANTAEHEYEKCSAAKAAQYATGIDAADLIARAATEACRPQMQALAQAIQRENQQPTYVVGLMEQINKDLVVKLKLQILEARSKK